MGRRAENVLASCMSRRDTAADWALEQVSAVRDDPAARLALLTRTYHGPTGRAPRHLPFRRAAMSFMRWQADRGVLDPLDATPPGSLWWREVNERLLRDGCEAMVRSGGLLGEPSSPTIGLWMGFIARPTARSWYREHNASIVCRLPGALAGPERMPSLRLHRAGPQRRKRSLADRSRTPITNGSGGARAGPARSRRRTHTGRDQRPYGGPLVSHHPPLGQIAFSERPHEHKTSVGRCTLTNFTPTRHQPRRVTLEPPR